MNSTAKKFEKEEKPEELTATRKSGLIDLKKSIGPGSGSLVLTTFNHIHN